MKTFFAALALWVAFGGGMYASKHTHENIFASRTGLELSKFFGVLDRCEAEAGKGNCKIIGGFVPKTWEPQPQAVPQSLEHTEKREL